jgi:hypothetical protein
MKLFRFLAMISLSVLVCSQAFAFRAGVEFWNRIQTTDYLSGLFSQGTNTGTTWDSTNNYLRLSQTGTATDLELDSSWTPAWSNLIAYWKLDETSGSATIADSSSSGTNTGNSNGTVNLGSAGQLKTAAALDGSSGYFTAGNFNLSTAWTISAWIKSSAAITAGNCIVASAFGGSNVQFNLGTTSGTALLYASYFQGSRVTTTGFNPTIGQWYHLVATYQGGSSPSLSLYVNGTLFSTVTAGVASSLNSDGGGTYIGHRWDGSGNNYFPGTVDDVAIWNTALSASAIATIYQHEFAKYAGTFQSRVMDGLSTKQSWASLQWMSTLPFGKELPDYASGSVQNETAANYSSLQGDTPAVGDNNLMTGITGLWHLDEANGTTGSGSLQDRSGSTNNGTPNGGVTLGTVGKLGSGATFDGSSGFISTSTGYGSPTVFTISVWFKTTTTAGGKLIGLGSSQSGGSGSYDRHIYMQNSGLLTFGIWNGSAQVVSTTSSYNDGNWHHAVGTLQPSGLAFYVDGKLIGTNPNGNPNGYYGWWLIGYDSLGGWPNGPSSNYFAGQIDEVAIWSKVLNATEVLELYRRGANRVRYQVRSCPDSTCSTSPTWLGPDGTNQTYFSELNNNSVPNDGADLTASDSVLATLPFLNFSKFSSFSMPTNRYFQYRAIMESDDPGTSCNYSGSSTWCSPEVKLIRAGP